MWSILYLPGLLEKIIKNPPAMAIFLSKDINCIWSEKFMWKIIDTTIVKMQSIIADSLVLYPNINNIGESFIDWKLDIFIKFFN